MRRATAMVCSHCIIISLRFLFFFLVSSHSQAYLAAIGRIGSIVAQFADGALLDRGTWLLGVTALSMFIAAVCAFLSPEPPDEMLPHGEAYESDEEHQQAAGEEGGWGVKAALLQNEVTRSS